MITCIACNATKPQEAFSVSALKKQDRRCKPCATAKTKRWREANPEKFRQMNQPSDKRREAGRRHYAKVKADPALMARRRQKCHDWHLEMKLRAFNVLGRECACCGESRIAFLQIDHINNDGSAHRRRLGMKVEGGMRAGGYQRRFYFEIIGGKKDGLQLMCANCNWGKARNGGICPHEEERINSAREAM